METQLKTIIKDLEKNINNLKYEEFNLIEFMGNLKISRAIREEVEEYYLNYFEDYLNILDTWEKQKEYIEGLELNFSLDNYFYAFKHLDNVDKVYINGYGNLENFSNEEYFNSLIDMLKDMV